MKGLNIHNCCCCVTAEDFFRRLDTSDTSPGSNWERGELWHLDPLEWVRVENGLDSYIETDRPYSTTGTWGSNGIKFSPRPILREWARWRAVEIDFSTDGEFLIQIGPGHAYNSTWQLTFDVINSSIRLQEQYRNQEGQDKLAIPYGMSAGQIYRVLIEQKPFTSSYTQWALNGTHVWISNNGGQSWTSVLSMIDGDWDEIFRMDEGSYARIHRYKEIQIYDPDLAADPGPAEDPDNWTGAHRDCTSYGHCLWPWLSPGTDLPTTVRVTLAGHVFNAPDTAGCNSAFNGTFFLDLLPLPYDENDPLYLEGFPSRASVCARWRGTWGSMGGTSWEMELVVHDLGMTIYAVSGSTRRAIGQLKWWDHPDHITYTDPMPAFWYTGPDNPWLTTPFFGFVGPGWQWNYTLLGCGSLDYFTGDRTCELYVP